MALSKRRLVKTGTFVAIAGLVIALSAWGIATKQRGKAEAIQSFVPNQLIVKFRSAKSDDQIKSIVGSSSVSSIKRLTTDNSSFLANSYVIGVKTSTGFFGTSLNDFERRLKSNNDVEYAQKNLIYKAAAIPNDPIYSRQDFGYYDQWGLYNMNASAAWDVTTGSDVAVAVLDTGVDYNHPDLKDNILKNSSGQVVGYDYIGNGTYQNPNPDTNPMDDGSGGLVGHGTAAAGIIGAMTNNSVGMAGVSWKTKIMPVRIIDANGWSNTAFLSQGLNFAIQNNAKIVNMSFIAPDPGETDTFTRDAIKSASAKGMVLIAPAGHENADASNYAPGWYSEVIVATGSDHLDERMDRSAQAAGFVANYGVKVDVAAPGDDAVTPRASAVPTTGGPCYSILDNYCGWIGGTSFAAAHTSGLAALILAKNPSFTPEQVRQVLRKGADDILTPGWDIYSGYGRINAQKSLAITAPMSAKIKGYAVASSVYSFSGIASGPNFASYELSYRTPSGSTWTPITTSTSPQIKESYLGQVSLPSTAYYVKLIVKNNSGETYEDMVNLAKLPKTTMVVGKIINSSSQPVAGAVAKAYLSGVKKASGITGSDGIYGMPDLKAGSSHTVTVLAAGYAYNPPITKTVTVGAAGLSTVLNISLTSVSTPRFTDVPFNYWAWLQIETASGLNIIQGYKESDGTFTFRPTVELTRDQLAVLMARTVAGGDANVPPGPATPSFSDVPTTYWAYKYIEYAKTKGLINGYSDGTFQPLTIVDRATMAVIMARALAGGEAAVPPGPSTPTFKDVPATFWAYKHIEYLYSKGVTTGYGGGEYRPNTVLTRDQAAVFIVRSYDL